MNEFLPEISFTEFHKLKPDQLRQLKNAEITFNGEYLFSFVNGRTEPSGYLRKRTENDGAAANAIGGETLEQILEKESVTA